MLAYVEINDPLASVEMRGHPVNTSLRPNSETGLGVEGPMETVLILDQFPRKVLAGLRDPTRGRITPTVSMRPTGDKRGNGALREARRDQHVGHCASPRLSKENISEEGRAERPGLVQSSHPVDRRAAAIAERQTE